MGEWKLYIVFDGGDYKKKKNPNHHKWRDTRKSEIADFYGLVQLTV